MIFSIILCLFGCAYGLNYNPVYGGYGLLTSSPQINYNQPPNPDDEKPSKPPPNVIDPSDPKPPLPWPIKPIVYGGYLSHSSYPNQASYSQYLPYNHNYVYNGLQGLYGERYQYPQEYQSPVSEGLRYDSQNGQSIESLAAQSSQQTVNQNQNRLVNSEQRIRFIQSPSNVELRPQSFQPIAEVIDVTQQQQQQQPLGLVQPIGSISNVPQLFRAQPFGSESNINPQTINISQGLPWKEILEIINKLIGGIGSNKNNEYILLNVRPIPESGQNSNLPFTNLQIINSANPDQPLVSTVPYVRSVEIPVAPQFTGGYNGFVSK